MSDQPTERTLEGMPCPRCRVDLVMSERQGVEIDYCPKCRGVWLDRGELDKIIERDAALSAGVPPTPPPPPAASPWGAGGSPFSPSAPSSWEVHDPYGQGSHGSSHGRHDRGRGHRSFLGRLFD